ncbi:hypothetical protein RAE21_13705 [Rhodoferax sp. TBRC 17198]|uniref:hypothetical protein n=1 Tax=Rhodoferax potami TaxID=3068338 RepID=UPI0028BDFD3A|nr:hypothetical protein [Rhodoferax sp. TBRC 17198]MDT7523446.1 hypothetical protein [Rhodoferax sp. TBRC 17198]
MKAFVIVVIVSAIIGGFVGGELTDRTFLLTGAVIGALGVGGTIFGLGWFFTVKRSFDLIQLSNANAAWI